MIKNRLYNSILTLLLFPFVVQAQADTDRNAYSIVQDATTEIICESTSSALRKESYTITILNEKRQVHLSPEILRRNNRCQW